MGRRSRRSGRGRRALSTFLLAAGIVLAAAAIVMLVRQQLRYKGQQDELHQIQEVAGAASDDSDQDGDGAPQVDWAALHAQSQAIVGWIEVPGTEISYPVAQGADNSYWLRHDFSGVDNGIGEIFLDCDNAAPGMQDPQTMIYGHHLKNGKMFKAVADMDSQERFDAVQTVWYLTEDKNYELEPLLLYYTQPDDHDARKTGFSSEEEFRSYLSGLLSRSVCSRADAADIISRTSHVLTMSTCNYYDGYGRTLLVCVPKDEAGPEG